LRRLSTKAQRAKPAPWLFASAGLIQGLVTFIASNNVTGICVALDGLKELGWGPILIGLANISGWR
jgi:hypothetical protein